FFIEFEIKDENDLKKRCEKALSVVSDYGNFTQNIFPIKKEKLNEVITKWQNSYPELREELEDWKQETRFAHETVALLHGSESKKIECVFLKVYCNSEESDILNCVNISLKPSKNSKVRNKIFKHESENIFNQLIK